MSDDFCIEHGYEFMRCDKVWGAIPVCTACDEQRNEDTMNRNRQTQQSRLQLEKAAREQAGAPRERAAAFKEGDKVRVYTWSEPRKLVGIGRISEIVPWLKGYDGPVACINIPDHSGRFLRSFDELENES